MKVYIPLLILNILVLLLHSGSIIPCELPPKIYRLDKKREIRHAKSIHFAKVISMSVREEKGHDLVKYTFKVLKTLKGSYEKKIENEFDIVSNDSKFQKFYLRIKSKIIK